ncbi:hypothetical protein SLA2020_187940 [Shorea laevis]
MSRKSKVSPELPLKIRLFSSVTTFFTDLSCRPNFTLNRRLFNLIDFKSPPSEKPINGVKSSDVTVDASRNLWFRLYTPTQDHDGDSMPIIVFFHGGGFAFMAANSKPYDDFCRRMAREIHSVVVSVNYRLSPEHRCPAQYEDCFDVLKFIDANDSFEGFGNADPKLCFLAGDSAGANLAHHVAIYASGYEFSRVNLAGLVAIQAFFGGQERTESEINLAGAPFVSVERTDWLWKAFLPEGSDRDHPMANVFGPNSKDITGLKFPATIVFVGGFDPLKDWQKRYYEGLKKCGKEAYLVEYPNAIHTFYAYPEVPESALFIKELKDFMEKQAN